MKWSGAHGEKRGAAALFGTLGGEQRSQPVLAAVLASIPFSVQAARAPGVLGTPGSPTPRGGD